jgi:hypothetical protein
MFLAMTVKLAPQAPRMGAGTSEGQQSDYIDEAQASIPTRHGGSASKNFIT